MIKTLIAASFTSLAAVLLSSSVGAGQSFMAAAKPADEVDEPPNELILPRQPLASGEVVAVNDEAGTITLRHKPILMETAQVDFEEI